MGSHRAFRGSPAGQTPFPNPPRPPTRPAGVSPPLRCHAGGRHSPCAFFRHTRQPRRCRSYGYHPIAVYRRCYVQKWKPRSTCLAAYLYTRAVTTTRGAFLCHRPRGPQRGHAPMAPGLRTPRRPWVPDLSSPSHCVASSCSFDSAGDYPTEGAAPPSYRATASCSTRFDAFAP